MARGIAKKSFMKCKRAKLDINSTIDTIIVDLESNSKLDNESKMKLLSFKSGASSDSESVASEIEDQSDSVKDKDPLFDIKLLNDIEDKMIRGSAKKIYMAGKRANKSSAEVIDDILNELSDKMDDNTKELVGGLK